MSKPRVAVLMGGTSSEHDVSLNSGAQVLAVLQDPVAVVIQRDGAWKVGARTHARIGEALDDLREQADVVFIALHGPFGEDGTVQGFLQTAGLAYTGSGVAASSLAMDKVRTKYIYRCANLPTADFEVLRPRTFDRAAALRAAARIGAPAAVKQACNGSSFGVSFPKTVSAIVETAEELIKQGQDVLVERYIKGRELTCGVLEDAGTGAVTALPITEIVPNERYDFFDYEAKYTPGATEEITPARIDGALADRVQALALEAHEALGCRDMSRTDFMLDDDGQPLLLETNTIPGLTATSLLPQAALAAGIDFRGLVARLVDSAARRRPHIGT